MSTMAQYSHASNVCQGWVHHTASTGRSPRQACLLSTVDRGLALPPSPARPVPCSDTGAGIGGWKPLRNFSAPPHPNLLPPGEKGSGGVGCPSFRVYTRVSSNSRRPQFHGATRRCRYGLISFAAQTCEQPCPCQRQRAPDGRRGRLTPTTSIRAVPGSQATRRGVGYSETGPETRMCCAHRVGMVTARSAALSWMCPARRSTSSTWAVVPGRTPLSWAKVEELVVVFALLGDPPDDHALSGGRLGQPTRPQKPLLAGRPGKGVSVGTGGRPPQRLVQMLLQPGGHGVLQPLRLVVGVGPVESEGVDQKPLYQVVAAG